MNTCRRASLPLIVHSCLRRSSPPQPITQRGGRITHVDKAPRPGRYKTSNIPQAYRPSSLQTLFTCVRRMFPNRQCGLRVVSRGRDYDIVRVWTRRNSSRFDWLATRFYFAIALPDVSREMLPSASFSIKRFLPLHFRGPSFFTFLFTSHLLPFVAN